MDPADIDHRFDFHPAATAERRDEHWSVRQTLKAAAHRINLLVPEGREKSLAITHLEDAMMWANAGIARRLDELVPGRAQRVLDQPPDAPRE